MIEVEVPNQGVVEFPDDTSKEVIVSALRQRFPPEPELEYKPSLMERVRQTGIGRQIFGPSPVEREAMIEKPVTPKVLLDTMFKFASPPPQIAQPIRAATDPLIKMLPKTAGGVAEGAREFGLSFPIGAAGVGMGKNIGRAIMGLFTGEFALGIPEQAAEFKKAVDAGDNKRAASIATQALLTGGLLGLGAKHEISEMRKPKPDVKKHLFAPDIKPEISPSPEAGGVTPIDEYLARQRFIPPENLIPGMKGGVTPINEFIIRNKPRKPEVNIPGTEAEPERNLTVLQEIRQKGARTKEQIRQLYPQLSREQAAKLRRQAWGEPPPEPEKPKTDPAIAPQIMQALQAGDLKAVKRLAKKIETESSDVPESVFGLEKGVENAIQEQTPDAVPIQPTPGDRGAVGEGIREAIKEPTGAQAEEAKPAGQKEGELLLTKPPEAAPPTEPDFVPTTKGQPKTGAVGNMQVGDQWRAGTQYKPGVQIITDPSEIPPGLFEKVPTRGEWLVRVDKEGTAFVYDADAAKPTAPPAEPAAPATEKPAAPPAEAAKPKKLNPQAQAMKERAASRPPDIIDYVKANIGKIRPKSAGKPGSEGYYDSDYDELAKSNAGRALLDAKGQSPDEAVDALRRAGILKPDATVNDMWMAMNRARAARRSYFKGETPEQKEEKFWGAQKSLIEKGKAQLVNVGDLGVGDKFTLKGEEMEIVSIDPDTGEVTVKNGKKFGAQTVPDGHEMPIDKGSLQKAPEEALPDLKTEASAPTPAPTPKPKPTGELFGSEEMPFNLMGERATTIPAKPEAVQPELQQTEMFQVQKIVNLKDPVKSADAAQQLYGAPAEAAKKLRHQLAVMDSDPKVKKTFSKEQRAMLKEVLTLLDQRATKEPLGPTQAPPETIEQKLKRLQKLESAQALKPKLNFIVHWVEKGQAKTRLFTEGSTAQEFAMDLRNKGMGAIQIKTQEQSNLGPTQGAGPGKAGAGTMGPDLGASTPEFYQGGASPTGIKNAAVDQQRIQRGLLPILLEARKAIPDVYDQAMAVIDADPTIGNKLGYQDRLIEDLRQKPRTLTPVEEIALLQRETDLRNEYHRAIRELNQAADDAKQYPGREGDAVEWKNRADALSDQMTDLEQVLRRVGTAWGISGRFRQLMMHEDYTLAEMELQKRAAKGGAPLTADERAKLVELQKRIEQGQKDYDAYVEKSKAQIAEAETARKLAELKAEQVQAAIPPPIIIKAAERIVRQLDTWADESRAFLKGKLFSIDPETLYHLARIGASHMGHLGLDFAKWSAKMVEDIGDRIKPHLQTVYAEAQKLIDEYSEKVEKSAGKAAAIADKVKQLTPEQAKQNIVNSIKRTQTAGEKKKLPYLLQKLAREFYKSGITDREKMVDALHDVLKQVQPEISRREVMDAWSGYGDYKQLSKEQITVALRGMKGELQQIAKLEDMARGVPPPKSGLERRTPTEAERKLIKAVNDAKYKFQVPVQDPETQLKSALDTLKTTLNNRIKDYQERLAKKDFAPRPRRELILDNEAIRLKAKAERAKQEFRDALEKDRRSRRTWLQKLGDLFVRVERGFKLSSPVVFGKLTSAAITRVGTTISEEVTGAGLGKLPVISTIARQAPREGGINVKAMAKGMADALTLGMKEAVQTAKTGKTDIEAALGLKHGVDPDWTSLLGQLHGMMKAPVKRFEITHSYEKRVAHAIANGVEVSDPGVQMRLMGEALNDGYRTIFMQRGFTADWFNRIVTQLERDKKYQPQGEVAARTLRFLFPIVRVPINIVSETATGTYGLATASARTLLHVIKGNLDQLPPEVADGIMRQFKKGSIGLGLMAIGYLNPQLIGGYDWREKRPVGTAKTGGFQIPVLAGVPGFGEHGDVPRWMTHAPWFELMQFGATMRHVKDQHVSRRSGETKASVKACGRRALAYWRKRHSSARWSGLVLPRRPQVSAIISWASWLKARSRPKPSRRSLSGPIPLRSASPRPYGSTLKWGYLV